MPRPFLSARWSNLCLFSYVVPPDLLRPRLPPGLELDTRDGQAFVSLVAFDFLQTRVWGIPWPGYRNFPELNLRFYVRHGPDRGVVFVREFVPRRLVAWMARRIYNENYLAAPLASTVQDGPDRIAVEHRLTWQGREHRLAIEGGKPAIVPAMDSTEHFFKEHQWGFGMDRHGRATRYQVRHPFWSVYPLQSYQVDIDWGSVYGPEWEMLQGQEPCSVALAAGSDITVFPFAHAPAFSAVTPPGRI